MISKRSCDTENWNNEENSALHHRNNITFYNVFKLKTFFNLIIFHNIAVLFFIFFCQINSALMSRRYLFQNH